jgi:hypothetical protein
MLLVSAALVCAGVAVRSNAFVNTPEPKDLALLECQRTLTKESTKAAAGAAKVYRKAIDMAVKDYFTKPDFSVATENTVVAALRKITDSRQLGKSIEERAVTKILEDCDPAANDFTIEDLLGDPGTTAQVPLNLKNAEAFAETILEAPSPLDNAEDIARFAVKNATTQTIRPIMNSVGNVGAVLDHLTQKIGAKTPPADDPTQITDIVETLAVVKKHVDHDGDGTIDPLPTTSSSTTSTSSSSSTSSSVAPNVCGNCIWEPGVGEQCDPCSPQAGPGCQGDCTCNMFDICNFF